MNTNISSVIPSKKKNLFFTFSLKDHIFPIIFTCFTIALVVFSKSNLAAAKSGLKLWANNVVPALFPFFIATELLSYTNVAQKVSSSLTRFMRPIFNVPGSGAYAFVLGIISGYPVGARIVSQFRDSNMCTKDECERMLAFTNNSGPLFIIGTVGITLFRSSTIGILLLISQIISSIIVGIMLGLISRFRTYSKHRYNLDEKMFRSSNPHTNCTIENLGEVLTTSILNAIKTIFIIGGFVVLFSVIISILNKSGMLLIISYIFYPIFSLLHVNISFIQPLLTGILELTNGVFLVSTVACKNLTLNIVICSFLLGFGGISVLLQVLSIISKSNLSIKIYFWGKLFQGIIAALLTYIFINSFCFLNFNL